MSPDAQRHEMLEAAVALATQIPGHFVRQFAAEVRTCSHGPDSQVVQSIPNPCYRTLAAGFVDSWRQRWPEVTATDLSMALETAAYAQESYHHRQQLELVWTGPASETIPVRDTEQVLLEMIRQATHSLTIISFGVYKIPRVKDALSSAADRGVAIRIILGDRDDESEHIRRRNLRAFGESLSARAKIYYWPPEKRLRDQSGNCGLMHAKCAIADREVMFLSSANLTENALALNMELGIRLTGGPQPAEVEKHFDHLIASGELVPLT